MSFSTLSLPCIFPQFQHWESRQFVVSSQITGQLPLIWVHFAACWSLWFMNYERRYVLDHWLYIIHAVCTVLIQIIWFSPYLSLRLSECMGHCRRHKLRQSSNLQKPFCALNILSVIKMFFFSHVVSPESCVAWLEVCLLCAAVPAMFPVAVIMGLFAEDCGGSNGQ